MLQTWKVIDWIIHNGASPWRARACACEQHKRIKPGTRCARACGAFAPIQSCAARSSQAHNAIDTCILYLFMCRYNNIMCVTRAEQYEPRNRPLFGWLLHSRMWGCVGGSRVNVVEMYVLLLSMGLMLVVVAIWSYLNSECKYGYSTHTHTPNAIRQNVLRVEEIHKQHTKPTHIIIEWMLHLYVCLVKWFSVFLLFLLLCIPSCIRIRVCLFAVSEFFCYVGEFTDYYTNSSRYVLCIFRVLMLCI